MEHLQIREFEFRLLKMLRLLPICRMYYSFFMLIMASYCI